MWFMRTVMEPVRIVKCFVCAVSLCACVCVCEAEYKEENTKCTEGEMSFFPQARQEMTPLLFPHLHCLAALSCPDLSYRRGKHRSECADRREDMLFLICRLH